MHDGQAYTLTVVAEGTGAGNVTSSPSGIACGTDCSESFINGVVVTLTAISDGDSVFVGWSGGGCSGKGTCETVMTSAVTVTARFNLLSPLSSDEGTIGTKITYSGSDLGTKKGKFYIGGLKQKIDSWTPTSISATVKKPPVPGEMAYDVSIEPKNAPHIDLAGGFTVKKPTINEAASDSHGLQNAEATIMGKWFGGKKGKVYLDSQKCKVTSWTMDPVTGDSTLTFIVHKKLGTGAYGLEVENKVGRSAPFDFTVGILPTP